MAGRDWTQEPFELTVPSGAGPTDPRIVIGNVVPAALTTFYAAPPGGGAYVVNAVILFYDGLGNYGYLADLTENPGTLQINMARGMVIAGVVREHEFMFVSVGTGRPTLWYGLQEPVDITLGRNYAAASEYVAALALVEYDFTIDAKSQPRGMKDRLDSAANSAAVGAEAVVLTGGTMIFRNGRAYKITFAGRMTSSAANITTVRIRQTNLAGAAKQGWVFPYAAALSRDETDYTYIKRTAGTNLTDNLVMTLQASAGTTTVTAAGTNPRWFEIEDAGPAGDYPNAVNI